MATTDVINRQLENAPLPKLIRSIAASITDAQHEMDRKSIEIFRMMANVEKHGIQLPGEEAPRSMIALGFTPSFMHFSEANMEAKVAFTVMESKESTLSTTAGVSFTVFSASVSASYTQKYSFSAEGSSSVSARITSVPAPSVLEELIRKSVRTGDQAAESSATTKEP